MSLARKILLEYWDQNLVDREMDTEVWKRVPIPLKTLHGNRDVDLGFSLTKTGEMMEILLL